MAEPRDYRSTVFLPKTDFAMKAGLPQKEPGIQARWEAEGLYRKLRESRAGREKFIFHDGPPYANGDMHIGHALNHTIKDMVCRTQNLLGKDAPYVPGWDCHGLPIEWKVEEQYRKAKKDKDQVPLLEFRAECRAYAQHWVDVQREQLKRLGVMADWDNPYLTMQPESEATIVAELLKFAESGQLYRGAKPVMWSPVEKTALAEAEVEYEDVVSTQIDVAFEIVESPIPELVGAHAVIWTTTPWTIPVNQAIAYGPEVEYVLVERDGRRVLIASELAASFTARVERSRDTQMEAQRPSTSLGTSGVVWQGKGSDLAGTVARHPMANHLRRPALDAGLGSSSGQGEDSQAPHQVRGDVGVNDGSSDFFERPRPFLPGDFVTTDTGTGLVHMAPDHGEDDFELCKAHGLNPKFAVEADGKYRADWGWLGGQGSVINPKFNAPDGPICSDLHETGSLLAASADYRHPYPHSWRSKAKVIFRCTPQWFVPMDKPLPEREDIPRCQYEVDARAENRVSTALDTSGDGDGEKKPLVSSEVETRRTLRQIALAEIERVKFIPEKGRNRIGSMVEGRPDWVLSRQRAWGVPMTLFVHRSTGVLLVDERVNRRIVDAVRAEGMDAWTPDTAHRFLRDDYDPAEWEPVSDILDVWFDSGASHAYVLESGRWPDLSWPADIYVEGSDQHRGWFQSSLLESCATRGRAPYDAILTHGFTMDAKGLKMSKSLGNTVDPIKVMETYGADIIRLWALTVDFTEDHRIGDEILKGVADQYRKLRNTFRYLLGALDGFSDAERRDDVDAFPELERYILALLARLDATLKTAAESYDFNTYTRALIDFCNEDLSAFFFDIRKDCLYCDAPTDPKRRAYRTVLDTLFHALVRYAAPVLVFTSEEVWGTRYPEGGSVHLLEWPTFPHQSRRPGEGRGLSDLSASGEGQMDPGLRRDDELIRKWATLREVRQGVLENIEPYRREKVLGSSLEARVTVLPADEARIALLTSVDLGEICIVSDLHVDQQAHGLHGVRVERTPLEKCGRCWRHLPEVREDGGLCSRCDQVVASMDAAHA